LPTGNPSPESRRLAYEIGTLLIAVFSAKEDELEGISRLEVANFSSEEARLSSPILFYFDSLVGRDKR